MAKEIPGFYYDEEKGKYFRIQQNHKVVPGTGYTKQFVKEAKQAKQEQKRAQRQIKRQQIGKIVRSSLLTQTRSPLIARLGATPRQNKQHFLNQYGASLSRCLLGATNPVRPGGHIHESGSFAITRSGILRACFRDHGSSQYPPGYGFERINPSDRLDEAVDPPSLRLWNHAMYDPEPYQLVQSVYDGSGEEQTVVVCGRLASLTIANVWEDGQTGDSGWMDLDFSSSIETIWDVTAAPTSPIVAVATNTGLLTIECHGGRIAHVDTNMPRGLSGNEQMNVSWKDSNIVMSGERSGRINFTDVRSGQSVVRLLHSSAVLGTSTLRDQNQILAHGYSTTSTYDLRWVRQTPVSRKARSTDSKQHSTPYMNFAVPSHKWTDHYTRGRKVAYSSDLDMVVAASSNVRKHRMCGYVTLYSAATGRFVDSPLTRHTFEDAVRGVEVRRVRDGPESVFCLHKDLEEWASGRLTCDEYDFYGLDYKTSAKYTNRSLPLELSFEQEWDKEKKKSESR